MAEHRAVGASGVDRISELPDGVIDNILKHLPLRDAVRTSILSRNWRYKWLTVPHLVFDWEFQNSLGRSQDPESLIDRLLLQHQGCIVKFSATGDNIAFHPAIDHWLHFLVGHPVEYLSVSQVVSYYGLETNYPLFPSHLFSFNNLKGLILSNALLRMPPAFKGFSKLVNLELAFVSIELEDLKTILSRCPVLEFLHLLNCKDTARWFLDINAPNLKRFHYFGNFTSISFGNASLEDISICYSHVKLMEQRRVLDIFGLRGRKSDLIQVFSQLPSIKKVRLDGGFLEFLALGVVPQNLPDDLIYLTLLNFERMDLGSIDHVSGALSLIRKSPNLQSLDIFLEGYNEESAIPYLKAQQMCNVGLNHLKHVGIFGISGLESELEFVRLVLLWAMRLEKLEIASIFKSVTDDDESEDEEPDEQNDEEYRKLWEEIASFPRSSSDVVIIFD